MGEADEAPDDSQSATGDKPAGRGWRSRLKLGAIITGVTAVILALVGLVNLILQVDPALAPCLGARDAHFTGAPVFPQYPYRSYLSDIGHPTAGYENPKGVEVRVSYKADNLRGYKLALRATLVKIGPGGEISGTYTSVLPQGIESESNASDIRFGPHAENFTPSKCSQVGGGALWLIPPSSRGRWQFILELFAGTNVADRLALGHTQVFRG
jgi:hypothetical protein